jgi:hypothetical protein
MLRDRCMSNLALRLVVAIQQHRSVPTMKALILITGIKPSQYLAPALRALEQVMTEEEKARAQVRGWDVQGVEPGGDEVFTFRIAADSADKDLPQKVFQAAEVDCRGVSGRGFIRSGQTSGSVEATITFQAAGIRFVEMGEVVAEQQRRQQQAEFDAQRRVVQRAAFDELARSVQARLSGSATTPEPAAVNGKASK